MEALARKNASMSAAVYPPNPIFRSPGERAVFEALLPQLSDEDVVFANLEISDPVEGDIEIDLAILLKHHGLVVVEVKGAHITHDGNDWIQSGHRAHIQFIPPLKREGICMRFATLSRESGP